jgi:hypothetical protein
MEAAGMTQCTAEILPSDGSAGEWVIVDAATGEPLDTQTKAAPLEETPCEMAGLAEVAPKLDMVMEKMAQVVSPEDFNRVQQSLSQISSMDGWAGCSQLVDSMVELESTTVMKADSRACLVPMELECSDQEREANDWMCPINPDWQDDPCCNPAKAFEQCCAPRDVEFPASEIKKITVSDKCSNDRRGKVMSALQKFRVASDLRNDPVRGCSAQRASKTGDDVWQRLSAFYQTCQTRLQSQQTKDGRDTCSSDDDCYTSCDLNNSPARCTHAHYNWETAFIKCSIHEMDPTLNNFFRESLGLTVDNTVQEVYNRMMELHGVDDCVGEGSWNMGGCWAAVDEATCKAESGEWWHPKTAHETDSPFAGTGHTCRLREFHFQQHHAYPYDESATPCDGDCQCTNLATQKFPSVGAVTGKFELYTNVYRHEWNETSQTSSRRIIAAGSKAACERDSRCNWAGGQQLTSEECLNPPFGSHFCGKSDGHWTHEISYFPRCSIRNLAVDNDKHHVHDNATCILNGGTWIPSQHDPLGMHECHDCCSLTSSLPQSLADCIDTTTLCKAKTETYFNHEYTHYGSCEGEAFCYDPNTMGNETSCKLKNQQSALHPKQHEWYYYTHEAWPKYTIDWEAVEGTNFDWQYYHTHGMLKTSVCMYGRRWGPKQYEGEGMYTDRTSCEGAGLVWHTPRRYESGRWATQADCAQGTCSSNPWDHRLADPTKCASEGGSCSERCKKCHRHDHGMDAVMCVATNITNDMDCHSIQNMQWRQDWQYNEETQNWEQSSVGACVGTTSSACSTRSDKVEVSCNDFGWDDCETGSKASDLHKAIFGGCYQDWHAQCDTQALCESGGQCDDWSYEHWTWDASLNRNKKGKVCRIPHKYRDPPHADIDWDACDAVRQKYNTDGHSDHRDACIIYGLTDAQCSTEGGAAVSRSNTKDTCEGRKACYDKYRGYPLDEEVDEAECNDVCDSNQYEYKSIHRFTSGIWSAAQMQPGTWTQRALSPQRQWRRQLNADAIYELVHAAMFRYFSEAYKTEQLCLLEPYISIFATVACACNPDGTEPAECAEVFQGNQGVTIAESCCFNDVDCNIVTAAGTVVIPQTSMSTATAGCSKKQLAFGFAGDQIQDSSRRQVSATTCNDYAVVPAASSGYCGQIIGNAFEIKGLSSLTAGSSLKVCLPIDNKIPTCPGKYTTYDISKAKSDRTPG